MSNVTDIDPLAAEPGVAVDPVTTAGQLDGADLVIVPGTRATVSDLNWMRENGIARFLVERTLRHGHYGPYARRHIPAVDTCG